MTPDEMNERELRVATLEALLRVAVALERLAACVAGHSGNEMFHNVGHSE